MTLSLANAPPRAVGKFLFADGRRLDVRGVTYGTFEPGRFGVPYPEPAVVRRDFAAMAAAGLNALRTYTVPPRWLLDEALEHGLRVMVGIPWEQHVTFLDEPGRARSIEGRVRAGVIQCRGHAAVLCYAMGNEIPSSIVRWSGRRRVERHLRRLYETAKEVEPDALVTYVNYPSTEYLELPFLDLLAYNVYLESTSRLEAYVARLQNQAGERPLVMAELGLDSRRAGTEAQARMVAEQIGAVFREGCAGAFVFSWTDEWHRGGQEVEDWDFGLTARDRSPKPALHAVRDAFARGPFDPEDELPRVSVVVCAYDAEATIGDCLRGLEALDYPDYEVVVVDDGSTDRTSAIARSFDVRLVRTENRGLSRARNTGIAAASGEIVAFIDADARPDPLWLRYLALTFASGDWQGVGGPNIAPDGDGLVADCVAHAPGGPIHVLLSDREAEHIPGCNMAFRRKALVELGGFDPRFRVAGDDVDLCWRLRERGWKLGFSPSAVVWHHCRTSVGAYWRQQRGYGVAEALLEAKWPEKYNSAGHVTWGGRVYGRLLQALPWGGRIYGGTWGLAPYQYLDPAPPHVLIALAGTPEWYLLLAALAGTSLLGFAWAPLLVAVPLLGLAAGALLVRAVVEACHARFTSRPADRATRLRRRALVGALHLVQPLARLQGRMRGGLTLWRLRGRSAVRPPLPRTLEVWSEAWKTPAARLGDIRAELRNGRAGVVSGGPWDPWDLEVKGGLLGRVRLKMAIEEHGRGRQMVRFRLQPRWTRWGIAAVGLPGAVAWSAAAAGAGLIAAVMAVIAAVAFLRGAMECGMAMDAAVAAASGHDDAPEAQDSEPEETPRSISAAVRLQEAG